LEIADDADLRVRAPLDHVPGTSAEIKRAAVRSLAGARDPRLPQAGTLLTREFQGRTIIVKVLAEGFEFEGSVYRSLTATIFSRLPPINFEPSLALGRKKPRLGHYNNVAWKDLKRLLVLQLQHLAHALRLIGWLATGQLAKRTRPGLQRLLPAGADREGVSHCGCEMRPAVVLDKATPIRTVPVPECG
jgi:hypothetical protein